MFLRFSEQDKETQGKQKDGEGRGRAVAGAEGDTNVTSSSYVPGLAIASVSQG